MSSSFKYSEHWESILCGRTTCPYDYVKQQPKSPPVNIILSQLNQLNVTLFFAFFSARFQIWAQKLPTLIRFFSFPSSLQVNSGTVPLFCPGSQPSQVVTNYCTISVSKISSTVSFSYRLLKLPLSESPVS